MSRRNPNIDEVWRIIGSLALIAAVVGFVVFIAPRIERWRAGIWGEEMQKHGVVAPGGAK